MKKKITAAVCAAAMIIPLAIPMPGANAEYKESDLKTAVENAIKWKDENDNPFYSIGTNSSDLYITALKRLGEKYDYPSYLAGLDGIAAGYGAEHKASDMQRTVLATISSGGDAQNVGGRDLLADSTFYRDATAPLGKEGANGYSWALIALDTRDYVIPEWGLQNRNTIIASLLSHQNTDGSFDGNVYATASAIAALARYRETSGSYTVTQQQTGWTIDISPENAVQNALTYLSDEQTADGDWGDLESTAMAVIALDTIGVDPDSDSRFTARRGSAIDGLMSYQNKNGGFAENGNKSDGEATSYAICALTAHLRKLQGKTALFNMNTQDTVNLSTAVATAAPTTSGSTSNSTARNNTSSSTQAARTATPAPRATAAATTRPVRTMTPTKTASPASSDNPAPTPIVKMTPKPTKRPALVGPVEMPGPMPTITPEPDDMAIDEEKDDIHVPVAPIAAGLAALLILAALTLVLYYKQNGKLPEVFSRKKKKKEEPYKAKQHRKTEQHRRFEERNKYKQRLKYKH